MPETRTYSLISNKQTSLYLSNKADIQDYLAATDSPVILDRKVFELHKDLFDLVSDAQILLLEAGEEHKNLISVKHIYDFLIKRKPDRNTEIIVIGGGTITDVAAYAVSTYKRGCRLHLIPTTLLGMVDAAVGGKTALNYPPAKNLIGSFYPADTVSIVPGFLSTLPGSELKNGLAEMLKLHFINPELPEPVPLSIASPDKLDIFSYACAKMEICSLDITDTGRRRILNLGHSFGHILESSSDYSIPHGEAVAWGIATAARVSEKFGFIKSFDCDLIVNKIKNLDFTTELDSTRSDMFLAAFPKLISYDKKSTDSNVTLILFKDSSSVEIIEGLPLQDIYNCLSSL